MRPVIWRVCPLCPDGIEFLVPDESPKQKACNMHLLAYEEKIRKPQLAATRKLARAKKKAFLAANRGRRAA